MFKFRKRIKNFAMSCLCFLTLAPNTRGAVEDFRNFVLAGDFQSTRSYDFCRTEALKQAATELAPKVATKKKPESFFNPSYKITKDELPQALRDMGPVQVLTLSGVVEVKPEFFATRDGQGCRDFMVTINPEKDVKLAAYEFIAIDRKFPPGAEIITVDKISTADADFKKIASKVHKSLTSKLSSKDRSSLKSLPMIGGTPRIKADFVKQIPIKIRGNRVWLVWIDGPWHEELLTKHGYTFSGAALFDNSGKLLSVLEPLHIGAGDLSRGWVPEVISDINGDGRQEILARHQGYEDGKIILHVISDDNKVESSTLKEWSDIGE